MVVSVSGFGYTGSGAVKDYLHEYTNIKISKAEFGFLCASDGLATLANHVMHPTNRTGVTYAISRYEQLTKRYESTFCKTYSVNKKQYRETVDEFINSITTVCWEDFYHLTTGFFSNIIINELLSKRVVPHIEFVLKKQIRLFPMKKVRLSGPSGCFYEAAKKHVSKLLDLMKLGNSEYVVLDQAFSANNPQVCFPFFDNSKVIIVDRDPRDLYVFSHEMLAGFGHFMPISNVIDFVNYYKCIRENQPYLLPDDNILLLRFEDLVYRYESTTERIRAFLGLPENKNRFAFFNPDVSIGNTQVYKRFAKYHEDVEYIEEQLGDYLFDFSEFSNAIIDRSMFV